MKKNPTHSYNFVITVNYLFIMPHDVFIKHSFKMHKTLLLFLENLTRFE